jgi:outer membrane lipoprotein carrier protein
MTPTAITRLLAMSLMLGIAAVGEARASSGRQQLEAFLQGLETFKAGFTQQVVGVGGGRVLTSEGTLYLQRPGRFRWEYRNPPQLVVADGSRVWLYDQELDQISHQSQSRALRGTPAQLLVETAPLERYFEISDPERGGELGWVRLRPLAEESEFVEILIGFADNQLKELEMADQFGQTTYFRFRDAQRNPKIDPELFVFRPPPGIDVMGTD